MYSLLYCEMIQSVHNNREENKFDADTVMFKEI